jgi:hypothetical protein
MIDPKPQLGAAALEANRIYFINRGIDAWSEWQHWRRLERQTLQKINELQQLEYQEAKDGI